MSLILLQITSLIYVVLLNVFYFAKSHITNAENMIYKYLLSLNALGLVIELCCFYSVSHMDIIPSALNTLITKSLLIYYLLFISVYTIYVFVISYKDETQDKKKLSNYYKKVKNYCLIAFGICAVIVSSLPLKYYYDGKYVYSYGAATDCLAIMLFITMTIWGIILIKKYKNIKVHKYAPVILFIILAGVGGAIQKIYPQILLTTPIETLIVFLMYFTIENPDMRLLEEAHRAKEISDSANEEKTLFLYNMTQEIRDFADKINDDADVILDSKDTEEIHDSARDIKAKTSEFTSMTNEILDVGTIDSANIKIYNNKYSVKNIIKQVVNVYSDICKNKELAFRTNIDHDVPESLYGDGISLKEVLNTVLSNSCKYTDRGYVELSVNTIIKNDVCRLIFTIEDSGPGIKSEEINQIKISDKSLAKANKTITLMNGTMLISSDYGVGTKVKIIIDQKIAEVEETEVSKYESTFDNISILTVDDNEAGLKIIEKLLKGTNIELDSAETGKECLDKIRVNKYDLILLDEELSQISGSDLLLKMKEIRNFNTPVLLLTKDNSYEYNEEYTKKGFADYVLKPLKKEILLDKINKNIKEDK
jgi:signal transduction histidine kinase/ActR/RegA family two-component response regulator